MEQYLLIAEGGVRPFDGDLNDYCRWLDQHRREERNGEGDAASEDDRTPRTSRKAARQAAADRRAALKPLRNKAKNLMELIEAQTEELKAIEQELGDPALYENENRDRLEDLLKRQGDLRRSLKKSEAEWMDAEAALDRADWA